MEIIESFSMPISFGAFLAGRHLPIPAFQKEKIISLVCDFYLEEKLQNGEVVIRGKRADEARKLLLEWNRDYCRVMFWALGNSNRQQSETQEERAFYRREALAHGVFLDCEIVRKPKSNKRQ